MMPGGMIPGAFGGISGWTSDGKFGGMFGGISGGMFGGISGWMSDGMSGGISVGCLAEYQDRRPMRECPQPQRLRAFYLSRRLSPFFLQHMPATRSVPGGALPLSSGVRCPCCSAGRCLCRPVCIVLVIRRGITFVVRCAWVLLFVGALLLSSGVRCPCCSAGHYLCCPVSARDATLLPGGLPCRPRKPLVPGHVSFACGIRWATAPRTF